MPCVHNAMPTTLHMCTSLPDTSISVWRLARRLVLHVTVSCKCLHPNRSGSFLCQGPRLNPQLYRCMVPTWVALGTASQLTYKVAVVWDKRTGLDLDTLDVVLSILQ